MVKFNKIKFKKRYNFSCGCHSNLTPNFEGSGKKLKQIFIKLESWMEQNQMQLNNSKTKTITHKSNNPIETVNSTKALNVLICDDLKWNSHIGTACKKEINVGDGF